MTQIRLGDLLIRAGVVNDTQLNAALNEQRQWGGRLGAILVRMGALSEDLLVKALSRQLNIARAQIGPTDPVAPLPPALLERIDRATCEKGLLLPVQYIQERRTLQVAVADPFNVVAIDDLSRRVGLRIEPLIAGETQILQAIARVFGGVSDLRGGDGAMAFVDNAGNPVGRGGTPAAGVPAASLPPQAAPVPMGAMNAGNTSGGMTLPQFPMPQPTMSMPPMPTQQTSPAPSLPGLAPPQMQAPRPPQEDLRILAEQQLRAVRALVELLVEKGVVSRAELQAWLGR